MKDLRSVGLFSGIGGIEIGFRSAGIGTEFLCEIDDAANRVIRQAFPDVPLQTDIQKLKSLPDVEVIAAGFPCQNLSLVGNNEGIHGKKSGIVNEVFRLLAKPLPSLKWVVLENVPFMLWHKSGHAIRYVTSKLERLGFRWAYRVVDTRSFGLPQRRRRILIVASRTEDPRSVLFADHMEPPRIEDDGQVPCGFSWTEGRAGLGWAINAVPTLKAGSGVGIPSPPAIWMRSEDSIVTPNICDAERLQGFPAGWTDIQINNRPIRLGFRWRMVGNAVTVPLSRWLGNRLYNPLPFDESCKLPKWQGGTWPNAAYGNSNSVFPVETSEYPLRKKMQGLDIFLRYPTHMLSARAAFGFLSRARSSSLKFAPGFLDAVERHVHRMRKDEAFSAVPAYLSNSSATT